MKDKLINAAELTKRIHAADFCNYCEREDCEYNTVECDADTVESAILNLIEHMAARVQEVQK